MPTYQYRCKNCGHDLEAVQKFTDAPLTTCPNCQGELRKVFSPVGIVFKGSGFYATDNRTKGGHAAASPGAEKSEKPAESTSGTDSAAPTSTPSAPKTVDKPTPSTGSTDAS